MTTVITREQGYAGFSPNIIRIVTTSTLVQVTTAGWYNNSPIAGESLSSVDQALICYAFGSSSQATAQFDIAISAKGVVTLSLSESSVILPVVSGDFPIFSGTSGAIADSGLAPSSTSGQHFVVTSPGSLTSGNFPLLNDTHGTLNTGRAPSAATAGYKVVMSPGSLTTGNFPTLADANGTIAGGLPPSAASQAFVVTSPGSLTSGNIPFLNDANGTLNTGRAPSAATAGYKVVMSPGTITVGNLLKAADANGTIADQGVAMKSVAQAAVAGGAAAQTVTDSFCTSASCVVATWNDTTNAVSIQKVVAGNGSFVITSSADPGASHLNYIITK